MKCYQAPTTHLNMSSRTSTHKTTLNCSFHVYEHKVAGKKLVKLLTCPDCITSLTSQPSTNCDQDCCGVRYNSAAAASAFTLFVNNGGLKIPSKSVFQIIEYAELVFKRNVCKEGNSISNKKNLKKTMIMSVCHHFVDIHQVLFADHEEDYQRKSVREMNIGQSLSNTVPTNILHCVFSLMRNVLMQMLYKRDSKVTGIV